MIEKAIRYIVNMSRPEVKEIGGKVYTDKHMSIVCGPLPVTLLINTLTGLHDYLDKNIDAIEKEKVMIHIRGYNMVTVIEPLDKNDFQRCTLIAASCENPVFPFNTMMQVEPFIVGLQSMFVQDYATAGLLKIAGNLKDEKVTNAVDDGRTQEVTVKTGVSMVEPVQAPNPVTLKPYRTFLEIEQPASDFVFRLNKGRTEDQLPTCALYDADGGAWKLMAIASIAKWIHEALPQVAIIA